MTILNTANTHHPDSHLDTLQNEYGNANPVIATSEYALKVREHAIALYVAPDTQKELQETDVVVINDEGVKAAARYVCVFSDQTFQPHS